MDVERLQNIFKVLGNESRLRILQLLLEKSYCGEELARMMNLTSATISHHMKKLDETGIIFSKKEQYYTNYYVNEDILSNILQADIFYSQTRRDDERAREAVDRYVKYQQKIIKDFFDQQGNLRSIPSQRKKRKVILQKIAESFEPGRQYSEMEVNLILAGFHEDFCTLRREMVGYQLMRRKDGYYRRVNNEMNKKREEFNLKDLLEVMMAEISRLKPEEKVREIAKYHRIQNSPGIDQAINQMANQLLAAGISTSVECFKSDDYTYYQDYLTPGGWVARKGQLRLVETGQILADHLIDPIQLLQRSCSTEGVERLEVFVVEDIEELLAEKPDLTGKILLTDQNVHKIKDLVHDPCNARGIIFDGLRKVIGRDLSEMKTARQYTSFWWREDDTPTFGFVITPEMGRQIRQQIQQGDKVVVDCEVEAEFIDNPLKVLRARIPGKSAENLLMVAHICHPYSSVNDNASGAAAGVEVLLFLQELIQKNILPQPERGIELILVPEYSGTFAFLDRYLANSKYLAGINLDMVGEDQAICGSILQIISPPLSMIGLTGDLIYYILKQVMAEHNFRLSKVPFMGGSDHAILSDPAVGIPCAMLNQEPDKFYHTDQDTIDKLDPVILKDVTLGTAVYLYYLANAHLSEIEEILDIYLQGFAEMVKDQIAEVMKRSAKDDLPNNVLAYCNRWVVRVSDRYVRVMEYFKKFIQPEELTYFQRVSTEWQRRCQEERSQLMKEMNEALRKLIKVKPDLSTSGPRILNQMDRELSNMIPKRKYWGFSSLNAGRFHLGRDNLQEVWRLIEAEGDVTVLAQFWVDGKRNLFEIMELVEMETGVRDAELLRDYFRLLKEIGSIEMHEKKV